MAFEIKATLPNEYSGYQWIADRLSKIDGVETILMKRVNDDLFMFLTNNRPGSSEKTYQFPLKESFFVDYTLAGDCPHNYDIMSLDDPEAMFKVIEAKAQMFFCNITLQ